MILFPNAKINLGLQILRKRSDGFHEISSLFYPIPLCDVLEFVPGDRDEFFSSGISIPGSGNLVLDALALLRTDFDIPPLQIHLHKHIPIGAGLGGGSADAAFMITGLNRAFDLNLSNLQMEQLAAELGSDCAFFIQNKTALASGRGEILNSFNLDLSGKFMVLHYPGIHVSTAEAYGAITPNDHRESLENILDKPITDWKSQLSNDFEEGVSKLHPVISDSIEQLYRAGAVYSAMTGSGSAVFGIFDKPVEVEFDQGDSFTFKLD